MLGVMTPAGVRTTLGAAAWAAAEEAKRGGPGGMPLSPAALQEAGGISMAVRGHWYAFRLMPCPRHDTADDPVLLL